MTLHSLPASYISLTQGRIAYDIEGDGPLVVLVPGMGDVRATYRFLAPGLRALGYRVACADLRGHGDSDATFDSYGDVETSSDIIALIEALGGPAVILGNSMGAGAAVLAAATRPELVRGLVLMGPFVRDPKIGVVARALLRLALSPRWAALTWKMHLPKLYAGKKPDDFGEYRDHVVASLQRRPHARAFSLTTRLSHAPVTEQLDKVSQPCLVVMGELDPDFPDAAAEAQWIAGALHAEVLMVPEAGHYPQSQQPQITLDAVGRFLAKVHHNA